MAISNFKNYFYNDIPNTVGCTVEPIKGIIDFEEIHFHFTKNASIGFCLWFEDQGHGQQWNVSTYKKLGDIEIDNNIYKFSAINFPGDITQLQDFQLFQIIISENGNIAKIDMSNYNNIIEQALYNNNNAFFRFSYNININEVTQFNDAILYIEREDSNNYTYINWISPIASGNDIIPFIQNTTINTTFIGDTSKCIKATSSTTWESSFKKTQGSMTSIENYHGIMNSITSKSYVRNNLVRFQDISLNSITFMATPQPVN